MIISSGKNIMPGDSVVEKILKILVEGEEKPETVGEALAFLETVAKEDIEPLITKLRDWAISGLKGEEATIAQKMIEEAKELLEE